MDRIADEDDPRRDLLLDDGREDGLGRERHALGRRGVFPLGREPDDDRVAVLLEADAGPERERPEEVLASEAEDGRLWAGRVAERISVRLTLEEEREIGDGRAFGVPLPGLRFLEAGLGVGGGVVGAAGLQRRQPAA